MICADCTSLVSSYRNGGPWGFEQRRYHEDVVDFRRPALSCLAADAKNGCLLCNLMLDAISAADYELLRPTVREGVLMLKVHPEKIEVSTSLREAVLLCSVDQVGASSLGCQPIQPDSGSEGNLDLIRSWIHQCDVNHRCTRKDSDTWLPTRLVFIDPSSDDLSSSLVVTKSSNISDIRYVALSHCWGASPKKIPRTLKNNISNHENEIPLKKLSKSFRDAILITKALGLKYIWIDSLCIVQDDAEDWETEAAQMELVYSRAFITICATKATGSESGCLGPRDPKHTTPVRQTLELPDSRTASLTIFPNFGTFINSMDGPLNRRGWTLQERELSPRILHFTVHRLIWECKTCFASEDFPKMRLKDSLPSKTKSDNVTARGPFLSPWRLLDSSTNSNGDLYRQWMETVEDYSSRSLSKQSDIFPAIAGLARGFSKLHSSSKYLAGLWKEDIFRGLSWFPALISRHNSVSSIGANRFPGAVEQRFKKVFSTFYAKGAKWPPLPVEIRAPSWSWAAYTGKVSYHNFEKSVLQWSVDSDGEWRHKKSDVTLISANVVLVGKDQFGRISDAEIIIESWTLQLRISEDDFEPGLENYRLANKADELATNARAWCVESPDEESRCKGPKCYAMKGVFGEGYSGSVYFDIDPNPLEKVGLLCIKIWSGKAVWPITGTRTENGLVLLPVKVKDGKELYRRVGMFHLELSTNNCWPEMATRRQVCII